MKKIEKASGGGEHMPTFFNYQGLLFFYENKTSKSLHLGGN